MNLTGKKTGKTHLCAIERFEKMFKIRTDIGRKSKCDDKTNFCPFCYSSSKLNSKMMEFRDLSEQDKNH